MASPAAIEARPEVDLVVLNHIQQRILWLSTYMNILWPGYTVSRKDGSALSSQQGRWCFHRCGDWVETFTAGSTGKQVGSLADPSNMRIWPPKRIESRANEDSTKPEVTDAEIDSARDFEEPI